MSEVKIKSLFKNHHPLRDQSIALNARSMMDKQKQMKHCDDIDHKYDGLSAATESYNIGVQNRVNEQVFNRQLAAATNRILLEGKDMIFKKLFGDLVVEALIIDKPEVEKREAGIREVIENYIDGEGGYAVLETAAAQQNIPILRKMYQICEEAAKKTTNRIRREAEANKEVVDPNAINFNMTEEEKQEIDYKKGEIALPEVSELVNKKVIQVVKDEKQRAQEEKEMQEAIENEISEEVGEEATTESYTAALNSRIIDRPVRETSTLYDSIFRNTVKTTVLEKNMSYDVKPSTKTDDYVETKLDLMTSQLFAAPEDDHELDLILAESVLQYTILECASTIRLIDFSPKEIRNISEKLLQ